MRIYKLTKMGKKVAKLPGPKREAILDHLYEFSTASHDELLALDSNARSKIVRFKSDGLVEELNGIS